jgi:hypothetical protein
VAADGLQTGSGEQGYAFGEALDRLLDRLHDAGLPIGPRERIAATALIARWLSAVDNASALAAPGREGDMMRALRPMLGPVLARTREERSVFHHVFDTLYPPRSAPPPLTRSSTSSAAKAAAAKLARPWFALRRVWLAAAVLLLAAIAAGAWLWLRAQPAAAPEAAPTIAPVSDIPLDAPTDIATDAAPEAAPTAEPEPPPPEGSQALLRRVMDSAVTHDNAPTLREIARDVLQTAPGEISGQAEPTVTVGEGPVLAGHTDVIFSAAFSPDGSRIVTASADRTARVWDAYTGAVLVTLSGHSDAVSAAAFSPDGARIVTASWDKTARVWDAKTGAGLITLSGHNDWVRSAAFSPDGASIVTASADDTAHIWNAGTGTTLATLVGHSGDVRDAAYSSNGAFIVTASLDKTARVWNARTGATVATLSGHSDEVWSAAFSQDVTRIVTASRDDTARIWDARTGTGLITLSGHSDDVNGAAFSSDGSHIVTASDDNTARVWDALTGANLATLSGHSDWVTSAAYSPDGTHIVTSSRDKTARIWSITVTPPPPAASAWTGDTYAERLHELTGLPRDTPLALIAADGRSGPVWARIAQALGRIEQPGAEPTLAELEADAARSIIEAQPQPEAVNDIIPREELGSQPASDLPRTLRIAAAIPTLFPDRSALPRSGEILAAIEAAPGLAGASIDDVTRALAINNYPTDMFGRAPWLPPPVRNASSPPPAWLPWAAGVLPLFAALWFASSLFMRKPYLRRRPPRVAPSHTDLVSNAGRRVGFDTGLFQRAAQRLLTRTPRPSAELDIPRTVAATLRAGGQHIALVFASPRSRPEYLVLIERAAVGDHDAHRLRQMVDRLKGLVDLDIYSFQTDPGELEPDAGGQRITIEQAQSRHPDHRLIILGEAAGFLDPVSLLPRDPARKLMFWERRALLTPIPIAEWGREEYALAEGLAMPVGRATPQGLLSLAELLGLTGGEAKARLHPRGDGLARPLPDLLRLRPQRFLFNTPPDAATLDDMMRELRNVLDPPAFDWFAALAVYPAVQWDLTLFLGVELPRVAGGDAVKDPLYDEARLAQITQLPWLRSGRMPNWLRRELIARLPPQRTAEVRAAIEKAIEAARPKTEKEDEALNLRFAQEPRKERGDPKRLFEDEVLLDFLSGGRREDFALPSLIKWRELFSKSFLDRLGAPETLAGAMAAAYAVSALFLAPKGPDPAVTGAYAPLILLMLGGLLAVTLWRPKKLARSTAGALERMAPPALAAGLAALLVAGLIVLLPMAWPSFGFGWPPWAPLVVAFGVFALATAPLLLFTRWLSERLGARVFAPPASTPAGLFDFARTSLFAVAASAAFAWAMTAIMQPGLLQVALLLAAPFGLFALGLIAARFAPESRTIAKARAAEERSGRWHIPFRLLLAGAPLALAFWAAMEVGAANQRMTLQADSTVGGVTSLVAQSADGRLVATAETGTSPRIAISTSSGRLISARGSTGLDGFSALAVGGAENAVAVAWSNLNGGVSIWRSGDAHEAPFSATDGSGGATTVQSSGVPPVLTLDSAGLLNVAYEQAGASWIVMGEQRMALDAAFGPPAAMVGVGEGDMALATLDGSIHVIRPGADGQLAATALAPPEGAPLAPARSLSFDAASNTLRGVLIDGTLISAQIGADGSGQIVRAGFAPALALGPAGEWTRAAEDVWAMKVAQWPALTYGQLAVIDNIVSVFETGRPISDASYSLVSASPRDPAILSYGLHQSALASGGLRRVIMRYRATAGALHAAEFDLFMEDITTANRTLAADTAFRALLQQAGADPAMQAAQAAESLLYMQPAFDLAKQQGFTQPLSYAAIYDAAIQSGMTGVNRFAATATAERGQPSAANEQVWIRAFIEARRAWLAGNANAAVRNSASRAQAFAALDRDGKWDLAPPVGIKAIALDRATLEPYAFALAELQPRLASAPVAAATPAPTPASTPEAGWTQSERQLAVNACTSSDRNRALCECGVRAIESALSPAGQRVFGALLRENPDGDFDTAELQRRLPARDWAAWQRLEAAGEASLCPEAAAPPASSSAVRAPSIVSPGAPQPQPSPAPSQPPGRAVASPTPQQSTAPQPSTPTTPAASVDPQLGDNSSRYANNGVCDDMRYAGIGMATFLINQDTGHDAVDCRAGIQRGDLHLRTARDPTVAQWNSAWEALRAQNTVRELTRRPAGIPARTDGTPSFGRDAGDMDRDGYCQDPRFFGAGMLPTYEDARSRDATDCRNAWLLGGIRLRRSGDPTPQAEHDAFDQRQAAQRASGTPTPAPAQSTPTPAPSASLTSSTVPGATNAAGAVSLRPGRWRWTHTTTLVGLPIREENTDCLIDTEAATTLARLARKLEPSCSVSNITPGQGTYSFRMSCSNASSGQTQASITFTETTMSLNARGSLSLAGVNTGFTARADASWVGQCTAAEIATERARGPRPTFTGFNNGRPEPAQPVQQSTPPAAPR